RRIGLEQIQRFDPVGRFRAVETCPGQDAREQLAARRVIIRHQDSLAGFFRHAFSFDSKRIAGGTVFFSTALVRARGPALHLAIVSGSTMNYNAYNVVETAYETFALVVAARCFCFAYRLRGRAARSPDPASVALSGRDSVSLSAAAAALRP